MIPATGSAADRLRQGMLETVLDGPLNVEARALLLLPESELFGDPEAPLSAVVRNRRARLIAAIGEPAPGVLAAATGGLEERWDIVAPIELLRPLADRLPRWSAEAASLYVLPENWRRTSTASERAAPGRAPGRIPLAPTPSDGRDIPLAPTEAPAEVVAIDRARPDLFGDLDGELGREVREAAGERPLTVAIVDGAAVCFCLSYLETETYWDVGIETLEDFRRRGLATACARALIHSQLGRGKRAVWGALESNHPSLRLAEHLGFEPCGRLAVYEWNPPAPVEG